MKKILSLLLCGIFLISSLFSCSQADNEQSPTASSAVGGDTEDNIATSESLEKFYSQLRDDEIYNYAHTTYEYTLSHIHFPTETDESKSGNSARINEIIYLNLYVQSIKPDFTQDWDYYLLGGGSSVYITITASDGSVLYLESDGSFNRYTLTLPDGTEEKAFCTCDYTYLASFLTALLCNS